MQHMIDDVLPGGFLPAICGTDLLAGGTAPRDYDDAAYGVMGLIGVAGL
jgi:hypothetical protein